jgi:DNA repair protein RadA/Sms
MVHPGTDFEALLASIEEFEPTFIVLDSVHVYQSSECGGRAGGITQSQHVVKKIVEMAQEYEASVFVVSHVNKEGVFAGSKTLEHLVDASLMLQAADNGMVSLSAEKNRYGSKMEKGLFRMTGRGLYPAEEVG